MPLDNTDAANHNPDLPDDEVFPDPMTDSTYLVIGQHYWGHGFSEAEAKALWKKQSSRLRLMDGYTVVEFPPGMEFKGVDGMGSTHWRWPEDVAEEDRVEPVVTEHPPKR